MCQQGKGYFVAQNIIFKYFSFNRFPLRCDVKKKYDIKYGSLKRGELIQIYKNNTFKILIMSKLNILKLLINILAVFRDI